MLTVCLYHLPCDLPSPHPPLYCTHTSEITSSHLMRRLMVMIDQVGNVQSVFVCFFLTWNSTQREESVNTVPRCIAPLPPSTKVCVYWGPLRGSARPEHQSFSVNSQSAYQSWETRVNIVFDSICFWQCKANGKLPPCCQPKATQRLQVGMSAAVQFPLRLNIWLKFKVAIMAAVFIYTNVYIKSKETNTSACNSFKTFSIIHGCGVHIKLLLHYLVYGVCQTMTLIKMITMKFHQEAPLGAKCYPHPHTL